MFVAGQVFRPNDIALYALSVGMGRDPLDTRQLAYVDPLQGPAVMPSMVLVMAHPGFWLVADPQSGVDPRAALHAAEAFEILGPIPAGGEVESRTRVTEVIDKGEGKAALILTETELCDGSDASSPGWSAPPSSAAAASAAAHPARLPRPKRLHRPLPMSWWI